MKSAAWILALVAAAAGGARAAIVSESWGAGPPKASRASDRPDRSRVTHPGTLKVVTAGSVPEDVVQSADKLWAEWLAVASDRRAYLGAMETAGFRAISVVTEGPFPLAEGDELLRGRIISIQVKGTR